LRELAAGHTSTFFAAFQGSGDEGILPHQVTAEELQGSNQVQQES